VDARGRLRAVPLGDRFTYARPEYRVGADGAPALARVVALAGDTATIGTSVASALGAATPDGTASPSAGPALDPLARARQLYLESRAALRRGDWGAVGRALDALGSTLGAGAAPARAP
jgi:uncharacterized membrane protein (UPF0182 family)